MKYFRRGSYKRPKVYIERALRAKRAYGGPRSFPRTGRAYKASGTYGTPYIARPFAMLNSSPFPQGKWCTVQFIKIVDTGATALGGLINGETLLRPNSLFDPGFNTISGNKATWWSTLSNVYSRYIVTAAKLDIVATNATNSGFAPTLAVCVQGADQGFTLNGKSLAIVGQYPSIEMLDVPAQTAGSGVHFSKFLRMHELEGCTYRQYFDAYVNNGAAMNTNPSRTPYIRIGCGAKDGNSGYSINLTIKLTFRVWLHQLNQSNFN